MAKRRRTSGESFLPKEIREAYLILLGFWISYVFGNIFYSSTSPQRVIMAYVIGGLLIFFIGMSLAAHFDNKAVISGSLIYYLLAWITWLAVCFALYAAENNLAFDKVKPFNFHVWLGAIIYTLRFISSELLRYKWINVLRR